MIEARRDHPELHLWGSCLAAAAAAALGKYDEVWRVYEEMEETYDGQSHKEKVADYLSLQVGTAFSKRIDF